MKNLKPFSHKDADKLAGKWITHKNNTGERFLIIGITAEGIYYGGRSYILTFSHLLQFHTFIDGSPCGKEPVWEPQIPEIGEWAFFWDNGETFAEWDKLTATDVDTTNKSKIIYQTSNDSIWDNCSKTLPPHLGGELTTMK